MEFEGLRVFIPIMVLMKSEEEKVKGIVERLITKAVLSKFDQYGLNLVLRMY